MNVIQHKVTEEEKIASADHRLHIICKKRKLEHLKNTSKRIRLNINTLWDTLCEKEITTERECRFLGHVCTTYFVYQYTIIVYLNFFHMPISFSVSINCKE